VKQCGPHCKQKSAAQAVQINKHQGGKVMKSEITKTANQTRTSFNWPVVRHILGGCVSVFVGLLLLFVLGCSKTSSPVSPAFQGVFIWEAQGYRADLEMPTKLRVTVDFRSNGTFTRRFLGAIGPKSEEAEIGKGTWQLKGSTVTCDDKFVYRIEGNELVLIENNEGPVEKPTRYVRQR
jgi:hypothetical protein